MKDSTLSQNIIESDMGRSPRLEWVGLGMAGDSNYNYYTKSKNFTKKHYIFGFMQNLR